mgnify:CR=1 FL=1
MDYSWSCHNCGDYNPPAQLRCIYCNCPAILSANELKRFRNGEEIDTTENHPRPLWIVHRYVRRFVYGYFIFCILATLILLGDLIVGLVLSIPTGLVLFGLVKKVNFVRRLLILALLPLVTYLAVTLVLSLSLAILSNAFTLDYVFDFLIAVLVLMPHATILIWLMDDRNRRGFRGVAI